MHKSNKGEILNKKCVYMFKFNKPKAKLLFATTVQDNGEKTIQFL